MARRPWRTWVSPVPDSLGLIRIDIQRSFTHRETALGYVLERLHQLPPGARAIINLQREGATKVCDTYMTLERKAGSRIEIQLYRNVKEDDECPQGGDQ